MVLSTTYDKYLLLYTTKSKQISKLSQRRGFKAYIGITGTLIPNMILLTAYSKYLLLFTTKK